MSQDYLDVNDYFSTSDLGLAVTISLYYPLETVDKSNPSKAIFLFKRDTQLDEIVQGYWNGTLKVNPIAYFSQLKVIKSRLYGG